jgi:O-acetyl-ADP-ribose deacetylase (regulator of RNase III)
VTGDATAPEGSGPRIIAHVCNDTGGWGSGFVLALSSRWPEPERACRRWARSGDGTFMLGGCQLVRVAPDLWVANLIGRHGIRRPGSKAPAPVRYEAIAQALPTLGEQATELGASVHMPRIGCGLAGGEWPRIEPLIAAGLCERGVDVTVYDPPESAWPASPYSFE